MRNKHTDQARGLAGRQGVMPHPTDPPRHNLTNGYLICNNRPSASRLAVIDGIYYLRDIPGRPGMPPGPGACGRVSCSDASAICKLVSPNVFDQHHGWLFTF